MGEDFKSSLCLPSATRRPESMRRRWSESSISSGLWVIIITVWVFLSSFKTLTILAVLAGSREEVTSSKSKTSERESRVRARDSSCFWPVERFSPSAMSGVS